jgi:nucleotide-binding universal stress UspA family protein
MGAPHDGDAMTFQPCEAPVQLQRVVVGTDFSEASMAAARWVAKYLAPDVGIVLAHAVDLPKPPAFLRGLLPTPAVVTDNAVLGAEQRLADLALTLEGGRVEPVVRLGSSAEILVELARNHEADIIVVGGHGSRRGVMGLAGTTTERLVRISPVPVLIARGLTDAQPVSVLAPIDESPSSSNVLAWGRLFSRHWKARLTACYVVDVLQAYGRVRTMSAAARVPEMEEELRAESRKWIVDRLAASGFAQDEADVRVMLGDPRSAIPLLADRADADLIIMGSRGAGAVGRAVLGSVASTVLSNTAYPVLIVVGRGSRAVILESVPTHRVVTPRSR